MRAEDRARLGGRINTAAVPGIEPQGQVYVRWVEHTGAFTDGTPYRLRRPLTTVHLNGDCGDAGGRVIPVGLRMPPALFGWELIAAVDDGYIEDFADPDNADGNGISGRVSRELHHADRQLRIGRVGRSRPRGRRRRTPVHLP